MSSPLDLACPCCGALNPHDFTFCHHCRTPRDPEGRAAAGKLPKKTAAKKSAAGAKKKK